MSDLISVAPLYTKARVHLTKIGNILCTGKGCIGCDRKFQSGKEDNLSQILGEVDSVDFSKQEPPFLSSSNIFENHEKKARRHGNTFPARIEGAKKKLNRAKFQSIKKRVAEQDNMSVNFPGTAPRQRINKPDLLAIRDSKDVSNRQPEGNLITARRFEQKTHKKSKTVSFAAPLIRQTTFTVGEEKRRFEIRVISSEKDRRKSIQSPENKQGSLIHARSKTYPFIAEKRTNFLKMLQNSNVGIFDIETMETKKSSKWVEEALKSGAKEEEIFPQIHAKGRKRAAKKTSVRRPALALNGNKGRKNEKPLTDGSRRHWVAYGENNSVLVIEHFHEKVNENDDSLHKLGFRSQQGPRCKNFPRVSILEIAESLDDMVQLGVVKLIQEVEGCWFILVSSRIIRDFLIQKGVTLRGRSFELIDLDVAAK